MAFRIHEYRRLHQEFLRHGFPPFHTHFCDYELSAIYGEWKLDLAKLDEYVHKRFGEYEKEGLSMSECISLHLGEKCAELIKELL
jgi:hypothetical protein